MNEQKNKVIKHGKNQIVWHNHSWGLSVEAPACPGRGGRLGLGGITNPPDTGEEVETEAGELIVAGGGGGVIIGDRFVTEAAPAKAASRPDPASIIPDNVPHKNVATGIISSKNF